MNSRPQNQPYQVPRRFGIRTMLIVITGFGLMLSFVKWAHIPPVVVIFYASFVVVIGGAQIVFERSPRLGSMFAGALFLPLLKLAAFVFDNGLEPINSGPFTGLLAEGRLLYSVVFGALYGYLSGTMLAGLYLVADKMQFVINRGFNHRVPTGTS